VSVIIPAYRELGRIGETVAALSAAFRSAGHSFEVLVVDDGSSDGTAEEAAAAGAAVLPLGRNLGKGEALAWGIAEAEGDVLLLLDADLRASAAEGVKLLEPVLAGEADMTVAVFPRVEGHKGGFGAVLKLAAWGLRRAGAAPMRAPLSGQRALSRAAWEKIGRLDPGFGIEMGLNLDAARAGLRVVEVETTMSHRVTGRDWAGFRHRARQFRDVLASILRRW
jgi:glycosyltransferase involved in cell wall biosynthesis